MLPNIIINISSCTCWCLLVLLCFVPLWASVIIICCSELCQLSEGTHNFVINSLQQGCLVVPTVRTLCTLCLLKLLRVKRMHKLTMNNRAVILSIWHLDLRSSSFWRKINRGIKIIVLVSSWIKKNPELLVNELEVKWSVSVDQWYNALTAKSFHVIPNLFPRVICRIKEVWRKW